MAKNSKGEPVGWVTVNGIHFPKWADGTIGWQNGEEDGSKKETTDKKDAARDKVFADDNVKKVRQQVKVMSNEELQTYIKENGVKYSGVGTVTKKTRQDMVEKDILQKQYKNEVSGKKTDKPTSKNTRYDTSRAIDVNGKKVGVKGKETHAQAIYRQAQEEQGLPVDKKFYKSLGETKAPVGHEAETRSPKVKTSSSNDDWKKGQNYTGSYTKKEAAMSDKEYEKSVYDRLRKNGWSEKMAKAEAAEQVKQRNDDLFGVGRKKK